MTQNEVLPSGSSANFDKITQRIPPDGLATLLKVSSSLASTLELNQVLQIAIESAVELFMLDTGAIYLLDGEHLYLGATTPPLPAEFPAELRLARLSDHPHIQQAVTDKAPVFLADARSARLTEAEQVVVTARQLVSILYFPLVLKDVAIGAFIVGTTRSPRFFLPAELDLCYILAYQVALAVANAQLFQQAQRALDELSLAYDNTLEGWSRVLDLRDHVTDEHTRRVADLTIALARRMQVPEEQLPHIRRGALLHDIGKIGLPDAILQKPAALTDEEWVLMRTHPEIAARIINEIEYLRPALDIPYCHHERWDGSGYPRGLRGEQIPLAARLFAVVDVFDALTSNRPYRKAWMQEEALAYLQEQAGRHFDPAAVQAFIALMGMEGASRGSSTG